MVTLHHFSGGFTRTSRSRLLLGSLDLEREQYSWKSESSQLLHRGSLRLGSMLFTSACGPVLATPSACSPGGGGTRWACRTAESKCSP